MDMLAVRGDIVRDICTFADKPYIAFSASVAGKREHEGPMGELFDLHCEDDRFGQDTWEKSEAESQRLALNFALSKGKLEPRSLGAIFAGDLINQCTSSAYGLVNFDVPFFGLYGACSTCAEGLILAAMCVNGGYFGSAAAVTSSHNCSAERQFRFPVEYGGQRTPTSQWTVTGAGAFIVDKGERGLYGARITEAVVGITRDFGITDANNMGAAMAPAAVDTLIRYFKGSKLSPDDFDLIVTGDLGAEGHGIVLEQTKSAGYDLSRVYNDCGLLIFNRDAQDMHAGGSGCACSALLLSAYILPRIGRGELNNVLFIGTGALLSPMAVQQGNSIPGVAHLVRIEKQ